MSNILLESNNLSKVYDQDLFLSRGKNFYALNNVSFVLNQGDFISVMGPSGSGKSTLINCLSGLVPATSGKLTYLGIHKDSMNEKQFCDFRSKHLGYVFQNNNLLSTLSIFDNIASTLLLQNVPKDEIYERVLKISKQLEIDQLLNKFPHECSGGQCQRAAIARAIVHNPSILICDEPTGNLDTKNCHNLLSILVDLNKQGTSIILVTHDSSVASYASSMVYLRDGQISSILSRNNASQEEFFYEIMKVTTKDSLVALFHPGQNKDTNESKVVSSNTFTNTKDMD